VSFAIVSKNLTKRFGNLTAVNKINLKIKRGELFGLLGPNGAGKTTFIHMLTTILRPTSGTARVAGHDILREPDAVRSSIGIVFQEHSLDDRLTGRENLDFHGRLYGMSREDRERRIREVLELMGLTKRADNLVRSYSGGMKRRLEIARGLMHRPEILFLDEPTLGLDPQTRQVVWDQIRSLSAQKITIILSTHYIEEADQLCSKVGIIDHGNIVAEGRPSELKDRLSGDVVILRVSNASHLLSIVSKQRNILRAKEVDGKLHLRVKNGERSLPKLLDLARANGVIVKEASLSKPSLHDVFIQLTGREIREETSAPKGRWHRW